MSVEVGKVGDNTVIVDIDIDRAQELTGLTVEFEAQIVGDVADPGFSLARFFHREPGHCRTLLCRGWKYIDEDDERQSENSDGATFVHVTYPKRN